MQLLLTAIQAQGVKQTNKSKEMITMQVADKNMLNSAYFLFIPQELHLTPFTAINQKIAIANIEKLAGLVSSVCRSSRIRS